MTKNDEIETSSKPMISKHGKFASSTKSASLVTFTAAQGFPLSTHRRSTQGLSFLGFGFGFSSTSTTGTPPLCAPFLILSSLKGQNSVGYYTSRGNKIEHHTQGIPKQHEIKVAIIFYLEKMSMFINIHNMIRV